MSGTFQLDGTLFPKDPLIKRWTRQRIAASGVGEPIYTAFWQIEMTFGLLDAADEVSYFEDKWLTGGLYTAVLPHPKTGQLVGFTGVAISDFTYEFNDFDSNAWAEGSQLTLTHINLSATGSV